LGRLDAAVAACGAALRIKPDLAEAHSNLGVVLHDLGRLEAAVASYGAALSIKPDYAEAHSNLGSALKDLGRLDDAAASYGAALRIKPDYAEAHSNLGAALNAMGNISGAIFAFDAALRLKPELAEARSNLLFLHAGQEWLDDRAYLALAREWEQASIAAAERSAARQRVMFRQPSAHARLRVGYVSGDFRQHAVSYFLEPILAHHDRRRVELFAYSSSARRDAVTERLTGLVDHWVSLVGLSDAAARQRIEADGIDVLIDLSGHTKGNRLGVFARRAAPVQAHYLGFFASTGLSEMDYWIGDESLTPATAKADFSETLWRLPRPWVSYDGKAAAPAPAWHPAADGSVWLGGFNRLVKLTPACLALWARVLAALPEGRLLLKSKELADPGTRRRLLASFEKLGIEDRRIDLQDGRATPDWPRHMAYYDRLDIALDPIGGVAGGTTTCDALWMGVPVIGLAGRRMATRMTGVMLHAIGHPEWLAIDEDDYVAKVVGLARDVALRRSLRFGLRPRMAASPLCDARGLARALEDAYAAMVAMRDPVMAETYGP
jgi:predicted O-linked N-acetylglucosamine transferase (SPINDLY family)